MRKKAMVYIASPPKRVGQALIAQATNHFSISIYRLKKCLLPRKIQSEGKTWVCPEEWL